MKALNKMLGGPVHGAWRLRVLGLYSAAKKKLKSDLRAAYRHLKGVTKMMELNVSSK